MLALLVFIYLGLASSGGTVPLQALPGFYRFVASFEPLRQIGAWSSRPSAWSCGSPSGPP
jgi:hypothetical protein